MTEYSEEQIAKIKEEAKTEGKAETLKQISTIVKPAGLSANAVRKPQIFKHGEDFNSYLEIWSNYARILNIAEADRGRLLFTFLDENCNDKISALKLTSDQKNDWNLVKRELKNILEVDNQQQARAKLFSMKQQLGETIEEFGRRIQKMSIKAYSMDSRDVIARDSNIKDVLLYGIANNAIALNLMNKPDLDTLDFAALYKNACNLEKNYDARKQASGTADIEILKSEVEPKRVDEGKIVKNIDQSCWNCGALDHWQSQCTKPRRENRKCHFCGQIGHLRNSCFKLQNLMRQNNAGKIKRGAPKMRQNWGGAPKINQNWGGAPKINQNWGGTPRPNQTWGQSSRYFERGGEINRGPKGKGYPGRKLDEGVRSAENEQAPHM